MTVKLLVKFIFAWVCLSPVPGLYAQSSSGQVEQSQRLIEKDRDLTERIIAEKTYYIEAIVVKGGTILSGDEVEKLIGPFQKKRLFGKDIEAILESVRTAYGKKGWRPDSIGVAYKVNENVLEINIDETALIHNPEEK
jgi:outer membrane protein assembly factor BamA